MAMWQRGSGVCSYVRDNCSHGSGHYGCVCSFVRTAQEPSQPWWPEPWLQLARTNEHTPEPRCHIDIDCNVYRIRTMSVNEIYGSAALFNRHADPARIHKDQDFDSIF